MARLIASARGASGDNPDYVRNTYEHLLSCGICDEKLAAVTRALDAASCRTAEAFADSPLRIANGRET